MSFNQSQYISGPPPPPPPPGPRAMDMGPSMYSPRGTTTTTVIDNGMREDYALLDNTYYEEDYLVPPSNNSSIAQIPPPKETHYHVNEDPSLGGETWRAPKPRAPLSDFTTNVLRTPASSEYERIIPWDHKKKDYVYGAIHDHVFRGRYCRRRLKRKLDYVKHNGSWDPVSGYNCCYICCLLTFAAILIAWIIFYIYKPYHYFPGYLNHWWWWILIPLFLILILLTCCCIVMASSNHATRNRYRYIKHACDDVNDRNLRGSGVEVRPGKMGGWLEVEMDPGRTDIVGNVIPDRRVYHGEERRVKSIREETIRREEYDQRSQIPIEGRPKRDYAPQEVREVEEIMVLEEPAYNGTGYGTTVVEETIVNNIASRPNNVVRSSNVINRSGVSVSNSRSPVNNVSSSSKKLSFYERLKASKNNGPSELRSSPMAVSGAKKETMNRSPSYQKVGGNASSDKKQAFYERLQKAKEMKERSRSPARR